MRCSYLKMKFGSALGHEKSYSSSTTDKVIVRAETVKLVITCTFFRCPSVHTLADRRCTLQTHSSTGEPLHSHTPGQGKACRSVQNKLSR